MGDITITVSDERLAQLQEIAKRLNIAPADLLRASLDDLLARPDDAFQRALERVLTKNAELYERLA